MQVDRCFVEVVFRLFDFGLEVDIAVFDVVDPDEVVDSIDVLHVHGDAFESVGDFCRDRVAWDAADLLEIGELRDFQQHNVKEAYGDGSYIFTEKIWLYGGTR